MRGLNYNIILTVCLLFSLVGCVTEDIRMTADSGVAYLRLDVTDVSSNVSSNVATKAGLPSTLPQEFIPSVDEFKIDVKRDGVSIEGFPKLYSAVKQKELILPVGAYTISASYGTNDFIQDKPYFFGSESITLLPNRQNVVSVKPVLENSLLTPVVDSKLKLHFKTWSLTVKVNTMSCLLASNTLQDKCLFVKAGMAVVGLFDGVNLLDGNIKRETQFVASSVKGTQYRIECNPENLPIFSLNMEATAQHTTNGTNLNGTDVMLRVVSLTGSPTGLITSWGAELYKGNTKIRSYEQSGVPTNNSSSKMNPEQGWPYVPQGMGYTLKPYLVLKTGEKVYSNDYTALNVPAPVFEITFKPYTSYNKYLERDISGANMCQNNMIYNLNGAVSIDNSLWSNSNYEKYFIYTFDNGTPERVNSNTFSKGNITVNDWRRYVATVDVLFDGVRKTVSPDLHITGLPYNVTPPKNSGDHPWSRVSGEIYWNPERVEMLCRSGEPAITSPVFYIPNDIGVTMAARVGRNWSAIWHGHNLEIYHDDKNKLVVQSLGKDEWYEKSTGAIMTSVLNKWTIHYCYGAAPPVIWVHYFRLNYR